MRKLVALIFPEHRIYKAAMPYMIPRKYMTKINEANIFFGDKCHVMIASRSVPDWSRKFYATELSCVIEYLPGHPPYMEDTDFEILLSRFRKEPPDFRSMNHPESVKIYLLQMFGTEDEVDEAILEEEKQLKKREEYERKYYE